MPSIKSTALLLALSSLPVSLWANAPGPLGNWLTSSGSIVKVAPCGREICLTVIKVSPKAPETHDVLNPDKTLQARALCGLRIGQGFKPDGPDAAIGGEIYDPESGKTYSGKMERKGDSLKLRGYIGISLIGRTEIWTRTSETPACH